MFKTAFHRRFARFGIWRITAPVLSLCFTLMVPHIVELEKAGVFFILMMCISGSISIFGVGISKYVAEENKKLSTHQFVNYVTVTAVLTLMCASTFFVFLNQGSEISASDTSLICICAGIAVINYLKIQRKVAVVRDFPASLVYFTQTLISILLSLIAMVITDEPIIWLVCFWCSQVVTSVYCDLKYNSRIDLPTYKIKSEHRSSRIFIQFFYTGVTLYLTQFLLTNSHRILLSSAPDLLAIMHAAMAPVTALLIFIDRFFYESHGKNFLRSRKISKPLHKKIMLSYLSYQLPAMALGMIVSTLVLVVIFGHIAFDLTSYVFFIFTCNFFFLLLVLYRQTNANLKKQNSNLNIPNLFILLMFGVLFFCSHRLQIELTYVSTLALLMGLASFLLERCFLRAQVNK
jgi:hypothetical protein